jgi:hypothetical protein
MGPRGSLKRRDSQDSWVRVAVRVGKQSGLLFLICTGWYCVRPARDAWPMPEGTRDSNMHAHVEPHGTSKAAVPPGSSTSTHKLSPGRGVKPPGRKSIKSLLNQSRLAIHGRRSCHIRKRRSGLQQVRPAAAHCPKRPAVPQRSLQMDHAMAPVPSLKTTGRHGKPWRPAPAKYTLSTTTSAGLSPVAPGLRAKPPSAGEQLR